MSEISREIIDEEGNWIWKGDFNRDAKFDWVNSKIFSDADISFIAKKVEVAFLFGEESVLCDASIVAFVRKKLGNQIGVVGIPCAAHQVFLDAPLSFVTAIRGIFAGWSHIHDSMKIVDNSEEDEELRREAILESRL